MSRPLRTCGLRCSLLGAASLPSVCTFLLFSPVIFDKNPALPRYRAFHTLFLYCGIRPERFTTRTHTVLCVGCHERGWRGWADRACLYLRQHRAIQPPHTLRFLLWALLRRHLVIRKVLGLCDAFLLAIWVLLGSVYLTRYPVCRTNIGNREDWYQNWHAIHHHFVSVSRYSACVNCFPSGFPF